MKKHKTLRILSIDFDLFQIVDADTVITRYPDGRDLPTGLSSLVWQSHYISNEEEIKNVGINTNMIDELKQLILKSTTHILPDAMICNSHKHIYNFIHSKLDESNYEQLAIDHLDMHHDLFNENTELDCGNWLSFLKNEMETNITWVANPISKEVYGLDKPGFEGIRTDLSDIKKHTWDIIFLCRSDNWLPPHLDPYFTDLAEFVIDNTSSCKYERDILKPRWNAAYQESIALAVGSVKCYNMVIDFRNCTTLEERDMVRDMYAKEVEKMDSADYIQYGNLMNLLFEDATNRICKEMGYKEEKRYLFANFLAYLKKKNKKN